MLRILILLGLSLVMSGCSSDKLSTIGADNFDSYMVGVIEMPLESFQKNKTLEPDYVNFLVQTKRNRYTRLSGGADKFTGTKISIESDLPDQITIQWKNYLPSQKNTQQCKADKIRHTRCIKWKKDGNEKIVSYENGKNICTKEKTFTYSTSCDHEELDGVLYEKTFELSDFKKTDKYKKWGKVYWPKIIFGSKNALSFTFVFENNDVELNIGEFHTKGNPFM